MESKFDPKIYTREKENVMAQAFGCDVVQIWQLLVSRLSDKVKELLLQFGWMSRSVVDIFFTVYAVHYLP